SSNSALSLSLLIFALIFLSGCPDPPVNIAPTIKITTTKTTVAPAEIITLTAEIDDEEGDDFTITWGCAEGESAFSNLSEDKLEVDWQAPLVFDTDSSIITVTADDGNKDGITIESALIIIKNNGPIINGLTSENPYILQGNLITITCNATDPDGGALNYTWSESYSGNAVGPNFQGEFTDTLLTQNTSVWKAPNTEGNFDITVKVTDNSGKITEKTMTLHVYSNYGVLWVTDVDTKRIKKYSSLGFYLLDVQGQFNDPRTVATYTGEFFGCYAGDYENGEIYEINVNGEITNTWSDFNHPIDIDIYQSEKRIMVLDIGDSSLTVININTKVIEGIYTGFSKPNSVKINQKNGDAWICDTGNDRIVRIVAGDPYGHIDSLQISNRIFNGSNSTEHNGYSKPEFLTFSHGKENIIYVSDYGDDAIEMIINDESTADGIYYEVNSQNGGYLNPGHIAVYAENVSTDKIWLIQNDGDIVFLSYTHDINESNHMILPAIDPQDISEFLQWPYRLYPDLVNEKIWVIDNGKNYIFSFYMDQTDDPDYYGPNDFDFNPVKITEFVRIEELSINQ
ncbi:MAG: hypothetical protein KAI81_02985, partial [Candidatus Marinimicrobia bacterium]|nr:hypothetical protein [Candidatus Neomarinimicrobiota bacterium]